MCVDPNVRRPDVCPARYDGAFVAAGATERSVRSCTTTRTQSPTGVIEITYRLSGSSQHVCAYDQATLSLVRETQCSDATVYCGGKALCASDGEPLALVCEPTAARGDGGADGSTPAGDFYCVDPRIRSSSMCPDRYSEQSPSGVSQRVESSCKPVGWHSYVYNVVTYTYGQDFHSCVYDGMFQTLVQQLHCTDTSAYCGLKSYCAADSDPIALVCLPRDVPDGGGQVRTDASVD